MRYFLGPLWRKFRTHLEDPQTHVKPKLIALGTNLLEMVLLFCNKKEKINKMQHDDAKEPAELSNDKGWYKINRSSLAVNILVPSYSSFTYFVYNITKLKDTLSVTFYKRS